MMSIAPQGRVSSSRQGSEGFEISIPAKQSIFLKLILGPAFVVWDDDASVSWLTVWLIGWNA